MKEFSVKIVIDKLVDLETLKKALGGDACRIVLARDGRTQVIKSALLDEAQLQEESELGAGDAVTAQDLAQAIYDAHDVQAVAIQRQKEAQIAAAYVQMDSDVRVDMVNVFGTSSPESATAYEKTWALMLETPADWSSAGLTARFDRGEYDSDGQGTMVAIQVGDALDTDAKIIAYAQACLDAVRAYGISRMQRIEQFRTERIAILNS